MIALIMAAGKGSRISSITNKLPKCFLELGGIKLIDHQINALKTFGINDIVIVTGYKANIIREYYQKENLTLLINPFYELTNVLSSVWFAKNYLSNGFYFMHADTYFEPEILNELIQYKEDIVLSVNKKNTIPEDMKVIVENNLIKLINKEMDCNSAYGEFIGLAKISSSIAPLVIEKIKSRIENENGKDYFFELVIQDLIDMNLDVHFHDINDKQAIEIDFPDDYEEAKNIYNQLN